MHTTGSDPSAGSTRPLPVRTGAFLLVLALALACSPADPLEQIQRLHAAGRFEESLDPLRELLDDRPDDPQVLYLYGVALTGVGLRTQAVWPLRRAMESPEWQTPAAIHLANVAITTGDWDMVLDVLDPLLERESDNVQALLLRAYARAQSRQDYEGALTDADAALAIDPRSGDALVIRAVALLGLERVDDAGEAIEAAAEHFEDAGLGLVEKPRFCVVRATFAREKGDPEKAAAVFDECVEAYPTSWVVVDEAVKHFDSVGRPDRSLEILRQAFEELPSFRSYRLSLVYRLAARGEEEEAEALLREATEAPAPDVAATAWTDLARYYFERERLDEAIAAFENALALVPDPGSEFFFAYADVLVAAGRYDRALELAEQMTVVPHRELVQGRVALERGDPGQALVHFTRGLELWPDNAVARYFAARAAEQIGDFDRAIEEYRYSIRADAGATDARLQLTRIYLATGDVASALEVLRHDVDNRPFRDEQYSLLELELLGRLGRGDQLPPRLQAVIRPRAMWPKAVAALASGARALRGPGGAARIILKADRLDLTDPGDAAALDVLVDDLVDLGRVQGARARVDAAIRAHPEVAVFHALRGRVAVRTEEGDAVARAAFERALALDPAEPVALLGLARLEAAAAERATALELYRRAAEAEPESTVALREAATLLEEAGRTGDAERMLDAALERDPYDGATALRLARMLLADGTPESRARVTTVLRRARRFGEEEAAEQLLEEMGATG
jgi:tetratricopeptide (TPR) repeat protein